MSERTNRGSGIPLQDNGYKPVDSGAQPVFEEVFSFENLMTSARKCCRNVRWKASVQMFEVNQMEWVTKLHRQIHNGSYRSMGFREFWIKERGKERFIQSVHVSERCVQKCLTDFALKPIIIPRLIYDNAASLPGKGTEFALKRFRKHLASHYRRYGDTGGVLVCDFKNYFGSIPHNKLLALLKSVIHDERIFNISKYFIDQFGDIGLGLGSEISQICAVFYPNILDHHIKERLHIKGYGRYMDDFYLIHEDVDYLRYCLNEIRRISHDDLALELNDKTQITKNNVVFLKRRHHLSETGAVISRLMRKNISGRRRTLRRQIANGVDYNQSFISWYGYANKWNSGRTVYEMKKEVLHGQGTRKGTGNNSQHDSGCRTQG